MDRSASILSTSSSGLPHRATWFCPRALLPILIIFAVFLIDLNTPNGVVDGFLYVAAVLVCVWVPAAHAALYTALGLMLPMILGFALSPNGVALDVAVANRCVAMGTIWLAAIAVWRNAQSARQRESTLTILQQQLRAAQGAVYQERIALSDWLRQEIGLELAMVDWRLNHLARRSRRGVEFKSEALLLRRAIQRANQSVSGKVIRLSDGL